MPKRQVIGVVKSDKMNKSRRVEIERLVQHKRYGKFMRRRTVCHVHDENNESHEGDLVEIIEAPPRSKLRPSVALAAAGANRLSSMPASCSVWRMQRYGHGCSAIATHTATPSARLPMPCVMAVRGKDRNR